MEEEKKNVNYYLSFTAIGLLEDMVYADKKKDPKERVNKSMFIETLICQEAERRKAK